MITCVVEYTIDATKADDFERFGRAWIAFVDLHALPVSPPGHPSHTPASASAGPLPRPLDLALR